MWIGWLREFEPCNHVVQVIWVTLTVWLMVRTISHFMNLLSTGRNPFLGITGNIKLWLFLLKRINSQSFVQKYLLSNQFLYLNDKNSTMSRLMNGIDYKHCRVNSMQSSLWKVISFRFLSRYIIPIIFVGPTLSKTIPNTGLYDCIVLKCQLFPRSNNK